jgi:hypothetical protein
MRENAEIDSQVSALEKSCLSVLAFLRKSYLERK